MSEPQHCPICETEYVAGIPACADCGGPLSPGPLENMVVAAPVAPAAASGAAFDTVLATLPGLQAHHAVQALLLENVPCFLECQGLTKTYQPGSPPNEPLAVTLPVTVRVRAADSDGAREILDSMEADDLIGEQWSEGQSVEAEPVSEDDEQARDAADVHAEAGAEAPQPQGTSMLTAAVVVAVVVGLLFLFGR
jgi:hypothetical protein